MQTQTLARRLRGRPRSGSEPTLPADQPTATCTRELAVRLTTEELLAKLDELTAKHNERVSVEADLKEVSSTYRDKLKKLNSEIQTLIRTATTKHEFREVECKESLDFDEGTVQTIRTDTGEVIETRAMTERERQQHLFAPSI